MITQVWRLKQLEYTWLRSLLEQYKDFWEVTRASLDFALRAAGVEPNEDVREPLMENYLHLDPYPEARDALAALEGRKLVILSNGSPAMLQAAVAGAGLDGVFDHVLSVEDVGVFKPHPKVYQLALDRQVVKWGQDQAVKAVPLAVFEDVGGPPAYRLHRDAEVTVLLAVKQKVVQNFAFRAKELTDGRIADVLKAIPTLVSGK